jgi:hypothetical protein
MGIRLSGCAVFNVNLITLYITHSCIIAHSQLQPGSLKLLFYFLCISTLVGINSLYRVAAHLVESLVERVSGDGLKRLPLVFIAERHVGKREYLSDYVALVIKRDNRGVYIAPNYISWVSLWLVGTGCDDIRLLPIRGQLELNIFRECVIESGTINVTLSEN